MRLAPMRSARRPQMTRPMSEPMPARLNTVAAAMALTPWSMALDAMWKMGPGGAAQRAAGGRGGRSADVEGGGGPRAGGGEFALRVRPRIAGKDREGDDHEPREVAD